MFAFKLEPSGRFERPSEAYKATALPIELTRQMSCFYEPSHGGYVPYHLYRSNFLLHDSNPHVQESTPSPSTA